MTLVSFNKNAITSGHLDQYGKQTVIADSQMSYRMEKHKMYRILLFIKSPSRSISLLMSGQNLERLITGE